MISIILRCVECLCVNVRMTLFFSNEDGILLSSHCLFTRDNDKDSVDTHAHTLICIYAANARSVTNQSEK